MKNVSNTIKVGMIALIIGAFSVNVWASNGTSETEPTKKLSKEELAVKDLEATIELQEDLSIFDEALEEEGILSCSKDIMVKILNASDEVVYEGSYNGFNITDPALKQFVSKADLLMTAGNVAYYMLF